MVKKIISIIKRAVLWVKSIASESDGTGSASRVAKLIIVISSMVALLAVVWFKHDLPSADQLSALAKVIAAGSVAYTANQLKDWLAGRSSPPGAEDTEQK
jgi:hypothetical protein